MAEVEAISTQDALFPSADLPTYFVDGIANFMPTSEVGRMYLVRFDPAFGGDAPARPRPVAQLVMSHTAFLQSFVFLERMVESLVRDGFVSQQQVDDLRARQGGARDIAHI